jgi:hypothetical protein
MPSLAAQLTALQASMNGGATLPSDDELDTAEVEAEEAEDLI